MLSLDEEVRLHTTNAERERYQSLATLFGIVTALDYLERAYIRDSITAAEYSPACTRLLSQYKSLFKLVADEVQNIQVFMTRYRLDAPAALHRINVGIPANVEHPDTAGGRPESKWVAETTQAFITFMDALKLHMRAKDQLHPLLQDIMTCIARLSGSAEWEGRGKIVGWYVLGHSLRSCSSLFRLITLNGMTASEEITDEQSRQVSAAPDHAHIADRCAAIVRRGPRLCGVFQKSQR